MTTQAPPTAVTEFEDQQLYPPEVLEQAEEELSTLTPTGYKQMVDYMHNLEEDSKIRLPEAGGTAWGDMYGKSGWKINLTSRAADLTVAAEMLLRTTLYLRDKYGFSFKEPKTAPPQSTDHTLPAQTVEPQTHAIPVTNEIRGPVYVNTQTGIAERPGPSVGNVGGEQNTVVLEVTAIKHVKTVDGKGDYLRAMGGKYSKWGVPAYDEVIPHDIQYKLWPVDELYNEIPPQMKFMTVEVFTGKDGKEKTKVVGFSSHV